MFNLSRVGLHRAQIFFDARSHFNVFAHQAPHHLVHVQDDAVQVQHFRFQDLLAAERQKLPHQRDGALGRVRNLLDVSTEFRLPPYAVQGEFHITLDNRQQVVEIVCHSSCEASHGLHSPRLLQLIFQHSPFRDVNDDAFHQRMAFASRHKNRIVAHPDDPAIFPLKPVLRLKTFGAHAILFRGFDKRMVFLSNMPHPVFRIGQPFLGRVTENRLHLRAHVVPFAVKAHFGDVTHRRHLFDEHLVLRFCFRICPLCFQAIADVPRHAHHAALGHRRDVHLQGNPRTILAA